MSNAMSRERVSGLRRIENEQPRSCELMSAVQRLAAANAQHGHSRPAALPNHYQALVLWLAE